MVYAHAGSEIENYLAKQISKVEAVLEIRLGSNASIHPNFIGHETLLYSCLKWTGQGNRKVYEQELKYAEQLASCAKESGLRRIVILSYPGAYINSDNSFLSHRATIDSLFQNAGLQIIVFKVQAIYANQIRQSSLGSLFFNTSSQAIIIPNKVSTMVYSISTERLLQAILAAESYERSSSFDLFDQVHHLPKFLELCHPNVTIRRVSPTVMKLKAFVKLSVSSPLLDLFLRPFVPMHNRRAIKELKLDLTPVQINYTEHYQSMHMLDSSVSVAI